MEHMTYKQQHYQAIFIRSDLQSVRTKIANLKFEPNNQTVKSKCDKAVKKLEEAYALLGDIESELLKLEDI